MVHLYEPPLLVEVSGPPSSPTAETLVQQGEEGAGQGRQEGEEVGREDQEGGRAGRAQIHRSHGDMTDPSLHQGPDLWTRGQEAEAKSGLILIVSTCHVPSCSDHLKLALYIASQLIISDVGNFM